MSIQVAMLDPHCASEEQCATWLDGMFGADRPAIRFRHRDGKAGYMYNGYYHQKIPSQCGGDLQQLVPYHDRDMNMQLNYVSLDSGTIWRFTEGKGIRVYNISVRHPHDMEAMLVLMSKAFRYVQERAGYDNEWSVASAWQHVDPEDNATQSAFIVAHYDQHEECYEIDEYENDEDEEVSRWYYDGDLGYHALETEQEVERCGSNWLSYIEGSSNCDRCCYAEEDCMCDDGYERSGLTWPDYIENECSKGMTFGVTSNLGCPSNEHTVVLMGKMHDDPNEVEQHDYTVIYPAGMATNCNEGYHYIDGIYAVRRPPSGFEEQSTKFNLELYSMEKAA